MQNGLTLPASESGGPHFVHRKQQPKTLPFDSVSKELVSKWNAHNGEWAMNIPSTHPRSMDSTPFCRTKAILGDLHGRLPGLQLHRYQRIWAHPLGQVPPSTELPTAGVKAVFLLHVRRDDFGQGGIWQTDLWALQGRARILMVSTSRDSPSSPDVVVNWDSLQGRLHSL